MESWIGWIVLGGIAGWIATAITKADGGLVKNIILGIVGGIAGGWLFSLIGASGVTGFNVWSLLVAVVGAVIVISIVDFLTRKK